MLSRIRVDGMLLCALDGRRIKITPDLCRASHCVCDPVGIRIEPFFIGGISSVIFSLSESSDIQLQRSI